MVFARPDRRVVRWWLLHKFSILLLCAACLLTAALFTWATTSESTAKKSVTNPTLPYTKPTLVVTTQSASACAAAEATLTELFRHYTAKDLFTRQPGVQTADLTPLAPTFASLETACTAGQVAAFYKDKVVPWSTTPANK